MICTIELPQTKANNVNPNKINQIVTVSIYLIFPEPAKIDTDYCQRSNRKQYLFFCHTIEGCIYHWGQNHQKNILSHIPRSRSIGNREYCIKNDTPTYSGIVYI